MTPPKISTKSSNPPKIFIFLKPPQKYWNSEFWTKKIARAYVCVKISEYPPPPGPIPTLTKIPGSVHDRCSPFYTYRWRSGVPVGRGWGYLILGLPIFFNICFGGGGGSEVWIYFGVSRIKSIFFGVKIFMFFFLVWLGSPPKWAILGTILGLF